MDDPEIRFEDDYLIIIDKPTGRVVNEVNTTTAKTIQSWLEENFHYPIFKYLEARNGIVHRLDKDTSGLMVIAKNIDTFYKMQKKFKDREIQKSYSALVHGYVKEHHNVINAPVGRLPWNRERFGVFLGGRQAETVYDVIGYYKDNEQNYTLISFFPKTGRTHQIRVHAKYIKHPIVSDIFYAGRKTSRLDLKWCPRLFLHAQMIEFVHPENNNVIKVKSNLPDDLKNALNHLEKI